MSAPIVFTIHGEPASKANSRDIVTRRYRDDTGRVKTRPMSIKSEKARAFEPAALLQIPAHCRVELTGAVRVFIRIYYATERPDLDESVILDAMQSRYRTVKRNGREARECVRKGCFANDRQVREKHVFHGIDAADPRAEIRVEPMTPQQIALSLACPIEALDPLEV
ncbi:endodeoxyribonuclease RusA [Caballeronia zhejiangensis]|uniref:Endodeoxyribonuclease RusA n=1 Tax=Caballeronia zhejiangensis TaxID=871203 RepID=A0A656QLH3_9BURK|nr:endodeoxyribonuclease RusA [Caballeronia zhejiangensis]KDR31542.1 endodeoxyribonuclease RusA [Caballeronia zhejiangensis]